MNTHTSTSTSSNAVANTQSASDIIPGTNGWTYAAAVAMHEECAREDRLFPTRRPRRTQSATRRAAALLLPTGWTGADVLEEMVDRQREDRLGLGTRVYGL
jgi:hypothetical protein